MALSLVALLVLAPALDFLPRHKVPSEYYEAVLALQSVQACHEKAERPAASAKRVFDWR